MKKDSNHIIKDSILSHESELDVNAMWDAVKPAPKRNKRILFFLLPIAILILGVSMYFFTNNIEPIHKDDTINNTAVLESNSTSVPARNLGVQESRIESLDSYTNPDDLSADDLKDPKTSAVLSNKKVDVNKKTNATAPRGNQRNSTKKLPATKKPQTEILEAKGDILAPRYSNGESTISKTNPALRNTIDAPIILMQNETKVKSKDDQNGPSQSSLVTLPRIMNLNMVVQDRIVPVFATRKISSETLINTNSNPIKKHAFYVLGGMGIQNSNTKLLGDNPSQADLDYLSEYEKTMSQLETVSVEAGYKFHILKHLAVSAGVYYQSLNEYFEWEGTYERDANGDILDRIIITEDGMIEEFVNADYIELVEAQIGHYNKKERIDIPLTIHLSNDWNKFSLGMCGGVSLNVWNQYSGKNISPDRLPILLNQSPATNFTTGLRYNTGLEFQYFLKNDWNFVSQLGISSWKDKVYDFETKYLLPKINIGLSKIF